MCYDCAANAGKHCSKCKTCLNGDAVCPSCGNKESAIFSGYVESFLSDTEIITIQLIDSENLNQTYEVIVSGGTLSDKTYTTAFSIQDVIYGTYTMKVSKADHVTHEYTITINPNSTTQNAKIHPIGDVNGDGKVSVADVTTISSHIKKTALITDDYMLKCADVNFDGKISVVDVTSVSSHIKKTALLWND